MSARRRNQVHPAETSSQRGTTTIDVESAANHANSTKSQPFNFKRKKKHSWSVGEVDNLGRLISVDDNEQINKYQTQYGRVFCRLQTEKRQRQVLPSYGRSKLAMDPVKSGNFLDRWKQSRQLAWKRTKVRWREFTIRLELWRGSFKTIEGHYGSGVAAYFMFLKWLFLLNLWIFLLMFIFIVLPQFIFKAQGYDWWGVGNTTTERLNLSAICSELYYVEVDSTDVSQLILDFLQGTGWLEATVLFYGFYSDKRLAIGTFNEDSYYYNMPLAYLLVSMSYIIISLIMMVRHTAKGMKVRIVESEDKYFQYGSLVFAGWDHSMNDPNTVSLKHKSVYNEMVADMEEERRAEKRRQRSGREKCSLFTIRVLINLFVLLCLAGGAYLIYYATEKSAEVADEDDYESMNKFLKLLFEFLPSLSITILNFVIPVLFQKVVKGEDYSPDTEVQVTLGRTVFLRLASLAVLIATIYTQVTCDAARDECDVGIQPECPDFRCWETYVGQQIYKLVILDFITVMFVVLCVNFPRTLIVTKCNCKLAKVVGKPEFEIPKHVLDLVYSQTLCWLGAFFSPLIPAICVLKSFIVFYLKKVTCIYNHVPAAKPYRASKSHAFFMIVLLTAFLLTCVPIGYIIWMLSPSKGCGPFRVYDKMYDIVNITIDTWPGVLQTIFTFIVSAGFIIPLVALLCVLVYYYATISSANKDMANLMKQQLVMEGKDKQFLLTRISELSGEGPPGAGRQIGSHGNKAAPAPRPAAAAAGAGGAGTSPSGQSDSTVVTSRVVKIDPSQTDETENVGW